jgi:hypothetical protein
MNANNPAGRLHALLTEGHRKLKDKPAEEVWAELLDVPKENKSLLLRRLGHVMALPAAIREKISNVQGIDSSVFLKELPRAEASFGILNFQMRWEEFITRFDRAVMYGLEVCSDVLSKQYPEKTISESSLAQLKTEVEELLNVLTSADIPNDLKQFIVEHLLAVKSVLEEYVILGSVPIQKEIRSVFGALAIDQTIYKRTRATTEGKRFWGIMRKLLLVTQTVMGMIQIGTDVISLLPEPQDGDATQTEGGSEGQVDGDRSTLA